MRNKFITLSFVMIVFSLCGVGESYSATVIVGPGQRYTTLRAGIAAMSGGDTLIIKRGTYQEPLASIPNGTAKAYTIIKAETDGGPIVTGTLQLTHTNSYVQIEGIKFSSTKHNSVLGNHIKIFRCAFEGAPTFGNVATVGIGTNDYNDTAYILLEDCWSYGRGGRYNFIVFNADHVIFRRCVARHDGHWRDNKGDPEAGFAVYNSSHVEVQNVIVLDSDLTTYHRWNRAFYTIWNAYSTGVGGIAHPTNNVNWTGAISVNNNEQCFESDGNPGYEIISTYTDVICWGGAVFSGGSSGNITVTINRGTFGKSSNPGWNGGFGKWSAGPSMRIKNSIVTGFERTDFGPGTEAEYSVTYNKGTKGKCSNCRTANPKTNGLLYLPRIEEGSKLKKWGANAEQVGATVLKRMGVSGTLWGEPGYNTLTDENLWPWPYEDRIKADMAAVSARGFATGNSRDGSPQTLTKYIWEYLGNTIPADIYGAGASVSSGRR